MPDDLLKEVDEHLDRRISLLRDSVELKLTKELNELLKQRFETTGKLISSAFALVAIVFTIFGVKNFFDVRSIAQTTAIEEVKKKISIDDPNSDFRRDIDKIVARGLIDSYLLALAKNKKERFAPDLAIGDADLRRIQNLVSDPETAIKDFTDAIEVLLKSAEASRDDRIRRFIVSVATGSDKKFDWINNQPEKRAAVLDKFAGNDLTDLTSALLSNKKTDQILIFSALKYAGSHEMEATNYIEPLVNRKKPEMYLTALRALGHTDIDSGVLKQEIERLYKSSDVDDWALCLRLLIDMSKPKRDDFFSSPAESNKRVEIVAPILQRIILNGAHFGLSSSFDNPSLSSIVMSSPSAGGGVRYSMSSDLVFGYSKRVVERVLRDSSANKPVFISNVRAFCLASDNQCWGVVKVELAEGDEIKLTNGSKVTKNDAPTGVTLRLKNPEASASVIAGWTDNETNRKTGLFDSIVSKGKTGFQIVIGKGIAEDGQL